MTPADLPRPGTRRRYTYEIRDPHFGWLRLERTWASREGAEQAARMSVYPARVVEARPDATR